MARLLLGVLALIALCSAHSMMICANYDLSSNTCKSYIRNYGPSLTSQAYRYSTSGTIGSTCQYDFKSPIASYYSGGANCGNYGGGCPAPMGTIAPGASFTAQWYARNHAVADQSPGNVVIYLSPMITGSTNADPDINGFKAKQICSGSYSNCPSGNGDAVPCYLTCTMPSDVASGNYTLMWYWDWTVNDKNIYTTCADIVVGNSAGSNTGGSVTTGSNTATSGSGTVSNTATSGSVTGSNTATSGFLTGNTESGGNALCFSQCDAKCGGGSNVVSCACKDGQMDTVSCTGGDAAETGSSSGSSVLEVVVAVLIVCVVAVLL